MTPDEFAARAPIHPDSLSDYRVWESLLRKWNARINLVAPNSLPYFWSRHALDSAQILPFIPDTAHTIVDFGSGAGFPGLAVAIEAKQSKRDQIVHFIESSGKKSSFLKSVSRETSAPTHIHSARIEALSPLDADIITARAFAPLTRILPLAWHHLSPNGKLVLLKGRSLTDEIADSHEGWEFRHKIHPSLSGDDGFIVEIDGLKPR